MKPGNLVTVNRGAPLYEEVVTEEGGTVRHLSCSIQESSLCLEIQRSTGLVEWSQILVHGKILWTGTDWLFNLQGKPVIDEAR